MSDYFLGEIRQIAFDRAPKGWALCQGQLLSIAQNTALFSLLGTQYGGNGQTTFALPDLRGVTPLAADDSGRFPVGARGGAAQVTLTQANLPAHNHQLVGTSGNGTTPSPQGALFATPRVGRAAQPAYGSTAAVSTAPDTLAVQGGSQPHNNLQPYLTVNFIIALNGIYPSRG
ncbi:tail fiber protein [Leifsonia sp. F6_8S_P_1B]|uniref:Tail fiber protein n=1 Tax=Leifsonia williamsii TaxID=3035919 RepID=A0ABT8K6N8_9MICO|nr:tail fiber protein [Leifsonia williamsii]MDN4613104.1 tail fiber protein [Leifsonia williamsii]